jgi:hypothetical protein
VLTGVALTRDSYGCAHLGREQAVEILYPTILKFISQKLFWLWPFLVGFAIVVGVYWLYRKVQQQETERGEP